MVSGEHVRDGGGHDFPKNKTRRAMAPTVKQNAIKRAAGKPDAPSMADMGSQMLKQLIMMPIMYYGNQIVWDKERIFLLEAVFLAVMVSGFCALQACLLIVARKQDKGRVLEGGDATIFVSTDALAADGSMSVHDYDTAKLNVTRMQLLVSAGIVWAVHAQWETQTPLLMISVVTPMQLWECKAIAIHLLGMQYKRPWAAASPGNPLAAWAESQRKNETTQATKETAPGGKVKVKAKAS